MNFLNHWLQTGCIDCKLAKTTTLCLFAPILPKTSLCLAPVKLDIQLFSKQLLARIFFSFLHSLLFREKAACFKFLVEHGRNFFSETIANIFFLSPSPAPLRKCPKKSDNVWLHTWIGTTTYITNNVNVSYALMALQEIPSKDGDCPSSFPETMSFKMKLWSMRSFSFLLKISMKKFLFFFEKFMS